MTCDTCQRTKRRKNKYGKLPPKEAETIPWDTLCVNLIGPYNIKRKNAKKPLTLWAVTMIDPATGWFETVSIDTKCANVIANTVEHTWFTCYPWPSQVVLDWGTEFMAEFTHMLETEYGTLTMEWARMNASIPMKPYDFSLEEDVYIADSLAVEADSNRLSSILDAKYAPTDIAKYVSEQKALSVKE